MRQKKKVSRRAGSFPAGFRIRVVKLFIEEGYTIGMLSEEFGCRQSTLNLSPFKFSIFYGTQHEKIWFRLRWFGVTVISISVFIKFKFVNFLFSCGPIGYFAKKRCNSY